VHQWTQKVEMSSHRTAEEHRSLRYRPALDGLRAIAVGSVFIYHAHESWMPGGWIGVDVFFVLSGFLITSLLLREHHSWGRISFLEFWTARARRLLPAVVLVLLAVLAVGSVWTIPVRRSSLSGDAIATFFYVANWHYFFGDEGYFATIAAPSPLRHTWSLAVEEQYYILFPILLTIILLISRRRAVTAAMLALLGVASASLMVALFDPNVDPVRVYYGTDTRAFELLVGATFAAIMAPGRQPVPLRIRQGFDRACRLLATPALVVVLIMCWFATDAQTALFSGLALPFCAVVAVVVIAATSEFSTPVQRLLTWEPLRRIGMVSYGLYLWHWPVIVFLSPDHVGFNQPVLLFVLHAAVTGALSYLSYRFVENPIRRHGLKALVPRRPRAGVPVALAGIAAVLVGAWAVPHSTAGTTVVASGKPATFTVPPYEAPPNQVKVMLVGNSIPLSLAKYFPDTQFPNLKVDQSTNVACDSYTAPKIVDGKESKPTAACLNWRAAWPRPIAINRPQVTLIFISQGSNDSRLLNGRVTDYHSTAHQNFLRESWTRDVNAARQAGSNKVAVINVACHRLPDFGAQEIELVNNDQATQELNMLVAAWGKSEGVPVIDQYSLLCKNGYSSTLNGVPVYSDGLHFTEQSGPVFWSWLAPQLVKIANG
jgi:peptidoglycan/LPS O-acetylase OafA/YrhL